MRRLAAAVAVLLAAGLGACGGGTATPQPSGSAATGAGGPAPSAGSPSDRSGAGGAAPWRAFPVRTAALVARDAPAVTSRVTARLAPRTKLGSPRVLMALRVVQGWVQVALPVRPNGRTAWVSARDVRLEPVTLRVTVDLGQRRLRLLRGTEVVADTRVAVGSSRHPTPTGRFSVTDRVQPPTAGGPYGAFALGLSAHSPTLTDFAGGDGQVAVHGTNDPGSIGRAVSHGCVRVPDAVARLLARVPLGTPVTIA